MSSLSMTSIMKGFGSVWSVAKPKVFFVIQLIKLQILLSKQDSVELDDVGTVTITRCRKTSRIKVVLLLNEDATKIIDGYKVDAEIYKKIFGEV